MISNNLLMKSLTLIFVFGLLLFACSDDSPTEPEATTGTMTDNDGNVYKTIKIGDQWWMAENLKTTTYRNGDPIPNVTDNDEWSELTNGAYCYYNNDINNATDYGALYNWYTVNDERNIAPDGWLVPTDDEWQTLVDYLSDVAGRKLKDTSRWYNDGNGTNESGFTAWPGGYRDSDYGGYFFTMDHNAFYWSATEFDNYSVWYRYLYYNSDDVYHSLNNKQYGYSIRLIKDN